MKLPSTLPQLPTTGLRVIRATESRREDKYNHPLANDVTLKTYKSTNGNFEPQILLP
jgi:hypothetical protein